MEFNRRITEQLQNWKISKLRKPLICKRCKTSRKNNFGYAICSKLSDMIYKNLR